MTRKRVLPLIIFLIAIGIGFFRLNSEPEKITAPSLNYAIPASCQDTQIIASILPTIPEAIFIDTPWDPARGTELFDVLNNNGIACSYGVQQAEIGTTILWVKDIKKLFSSHVSNWNAQGFTQVDIDNISEDSAYYLYKPQSPTQEFHVWTLNILIHGIWIQINATFLNSLEDATPLIQASLESLQTS